MRLPIGIHTCPAVAGVIGESRIPPRGASIRNGTKMASAAIPRRSRALSRRIRFWVWLRAGRAIDDDARRYLSRFGRAAVADSQRTAYYGDMPGLRGGH